MAKPTAKPKWTPRHTRTLIVAGAALALFVVADLSLTAYAASFKGKMLPNVFIGTVEVSGLTVEEATGRLAEAAGAMSDRGLSFTAEGKAEVLPAAVPSKAGIDSAYPLYTYHVEATVQRAYDFGHESNVLKRPFSALWALVADWVVPAAVELDENRLEELLRAAFGDLAQPATDAHFALDGGQRLTVAADKRGRDFDYASVAVEAKNRLEGLYDAPVSFSLVADEPRITAAQATALLPAAQAVVNRSPFVLEFDEKTWTLDRDAAAAGLDVIRQGNTAAAAFSVEKLESFLDRIAEAVDVAARDAKFEIRGGRVAEFQASQRGRSLDREATVAEMNAAFVAASRSSATAVVREVAPAVTENEGESLGITERVGVGSTNFKGSPTNRRKNIANGARLLNGILIKPGETFSLIKALAPFEKSNGYLPELVIKGDRTIPEIGGGLCQIGTTMFRLVLNAGLPILERQNHSYRVSYYEPPVGMDATIYEPKPDFRFTNDYASHLLLQTRVEGDTLTFEFYGTADGRKVETTTPRMWNVTKPGPTKVIETTDLKPGERKCIEKAHNGADAEFTYTVTYADGSVKATTFRSHYKSWQEVCLVGVKAGGSANEDAAAAEEEDFVPQDTGAIEER